MSAFRIGHLLTCVEIPDRHQGYFTVGQEYAVAAIDSEDPLLPLLMECDTSITLWCERSAFISDAREGESK